MQYEPLGVRTLEDMIKAVLSTFNVRYELDIFTMPNLDGQKIRIGSPDFLTIDDFVDAAWEKNRIRECA